MTQSQRRSTAPARTVDDTVTLPATLSADVAAEAARVIARAEAMGLVELGDDHTMDADILSLAMDAFVRVGIGRQLVRIDDVAANPRGALELLNRSIEASPHPDTEWSAVVGIIGVDLAVGLLGVSVSSLKRYTSGERPTPDDVALRLHHLAMVVADLLGSYNGYGVRRWFVRPRRALGGETPAGVLHPGWTPDDDAAVQVAALAESLIFLGAT